MIPLYTQKDLLDSKRYAGLSLILIVTVPLVLLAVCVFLCMRVNTGNAGRLLYWVIGISTLGGWAALGGWFLFYRPARAVETHLEKTVFRADAEKTVYGGNVRLSGREMQIPSGLRVRTLTVESDEVLKTFTISALAAGRLPSPETLCALEVTDGFITAYEVRT